MEVSYIDHMGSDLTVVNSARVSFDKKSEWHDTGYVRPITLDPVVNLKSSDEKLIKYLAEHGHWSPFAHCFLQLRIKAPIFVARQLVKHQVGLSWNEVSRRYVDTPPEFHIPSSWRKRASDKKQGSSSETQTKFTQGGWDDSFECEISPFYDLTVKACLKFYNELIASGIAPEQARMVLPQSMMTEWYWSGSLYAFARICNERCAPDAQEETKFVANKISAIAKEHFPVSWKYLVKYSNQGEQQ